MRTFLGIGVLSARLRRCAALCALIAVAAALPVSLVPSAGAQTDTGSWTTVASMVRGGNTTEATAGIGGDRHLYYVRGETFNEVYDIDGDVWSPLPNIPIPYLSWVATATGSDGRIYAIGGGVSGATATPLVHAYDPTRPELGWQRVAELGTPRMSAAAAAGSDGRIYVMGGSAAPAVAVTASRPTTPSAPSSDGSRWLP